MDIEERTQEQEETQENVCEKPQEAVSEETQNTESEVSQEESEEKPAVEITNE